MDMIALTTIHRAKKAGKEATATSKAVPPETEAIATGEPFVATAEEAEELIRLGAAKKDSTKKNTKSDPVKAAVQQGEKSPDEMTVPEIKAELDSTKTEYPSDAKKDDLVKLLTETRSGGLV